MTVDQYRSRLSLLSYKIYKKVKAGKMPHSVYRTIYYLVVDEARRATNINKSA